MKNILILGAGSAGTMMVNHLQRKLNLNEWRITVVDQSPVHYYQPGFLFIPFGVYTEKDVVLPKKNFIPRDVKYVLGKIDKVDHANNQVLLADGKQLAYDILIIATGSNIVPEELEGLLGEEWRHSIFDFYTLEGSVALAEKLKDWPGGKMVIHINEMPIKCPVAPLEFAFLADWFFTTRGIRDKVEISYVTPMSSAFTKPMAAKLLGSLLDKKGISIIPEFTTECVDNQEKKLVGFDGREVPFDLLVSIPTHMGDPAMARSGLGDDLNFIPTDKHTLQSKARENIFVIGDATDLPASKAGSVAHFQAETLTENILKYIQGQPLEPSFDGHANCFVETGFGKALLIDFNYDVEPLPGTFPLPGVGPMSLLKESRLNHLGKMAFKSIYWTALLRGWPLPGISSQLSMLGKKKTKI